MSVPKKAGKGDPPKKKQSRNTTKGLSSAYVDLSFKVDPEFRREFRLLSADMDISHKDLLIKAFYFFRDNWEG